MIQWVEEHRVPGTLGATGLDEAQNYHAKGMLTAWNKSQNEVFPGYPAVTEANLNSPDLQWNVWSFRDAQMLGLFTNWWNLPANPPLKTWGQQPLPPPSYTTGIQQSDLTMAHINALDTWATKTGAGLPSCLESCLATLGGMNATPANRLNCAAGCMGKPVPFPAPTPPPAPPPPQVVVPPVVPSNPLPLPEGIAKGVCESAGNVWDAVNKVCHTPCPTGQVWNGTACVSPPSPPGPVPGSPGSNFNPGPPPAPSKPSSNASLIVGVLGVIGLIGIVLSATRGGGNPFKAEVPKRTLGENPYASREHLRRMTKADAKKMFEQYVLPGIEEQYGPTDAVAIRTAWNDFVDSLQKDGRITEKQAATWLSPYDR